MTAPLSPDSPEQLSPAQASPGQFGLWGKETERDWPLITPEEASQVLHDFRIDLQGPIAWHSARPFSAVSRLSDREGRVWFLKRHHHALRDEEALAEEHHLITHLAGRGLAVAQARTTRDGDDVVRLGAWCYECFACLDGADLYRDTMSWEPYANPRHAFEAGAALARFHDAATGFGAPSRATRPLVSALSPFWGKDGSQKEGILAAFDDWLTRQGAVKAAIDRQGGLLPVLDQLAPFVERAAPFLDNPALLWGHGDWHGSNLVWQGEPGRETVLAPFDFGMADLTTRGFDIAVALERSMIDWMHPQHDTLEATCPGTQGRGANYAVMSAQISSFLDGYGAHTRLTARDLAEIAAMLPLAHVVFACSEIWYYDTLLHAAETARTTYETYLMGHLSWFASQDGRDLCQRVATLPVRL